MFLLIFAGVATDCMFGIKSKKNLKKTSKKEKTLKKKISKKKNLSRE